MIQTNNHTNTIPLVSVIMPAYNAERYIAAAIESIMTGTFRHFQVIVVDDASTDKTAHIVKNLVKKYPGKITLIELTKNMNAGGDACANIALRHATGKYVARMDADDIAMPTRLEKQVAYLETHPDTFLVGGSAHVIDTRGHTIGKKLEPTNFTTIKKQFFSIHPLIHSTCMFRRFKKDGTPFMYRIKYTANNDYYTFFSLLCEGYQYANLPDMLLYYRVHTKSATFQNLRANFMNTLYIRMEMIRRYAYRPTIKDIVLLAAQSAVAFILPNSILRSLYMFMRGFKKQHISAAVLAKTA